LESTSMKYWGEDTFDVTSKALAEGAREHCEMLQTRENTRRTILEVKSNLILGRVKIILALSIAEYSENQARMVGVKRSRCCKC